MDSVEWGGEAVFSWISISEQEADCSMVGLQGIRCSVESSDQVDGALSFEADGDETLIEIGSAHEREKRSSLMLAVELEEKVVPEGQFPRTKRSQARIDIEEKIFRTVATLREIGGLIRTSVLSMDIFPPPWSCQFACLDDFVR